MIGTFLPEVPEIVNNIQCNHVPADLSEFHRPADIIWKDYSIQNIPKIACDSEFLYMYYINSSDNYMHIKKVLLSDPSIEIWDIKTAFSYQSSATCKIDTDSNTDKIAVIYNYFINSTNYYCLYSKEDGSLISSITGRSPEQIIMKDDNDIMIERYNYKIYINGNVNSIENGNSYFREMTFDENNNLLYLLFNPTQTDSSYNSDKKIGVYEVNFETNQIELVQITQFTEFQLGGDYNSAQHIMNLTDNYLMVYNNYGKVGILDKNDLSSWIKVYFLTDFDRYNEGYVKHRMNKVSSYNNISFIVFREIYENTIAFTYYNILTGVKSKANAVCIEIDKSITDQYFPYTADSDYISAASDIMDDGSAILVYKKIASYYNNNSSSVDGVAYLARVQVLDQIDVFAQKLKLFKEKED